MVTLADSLVSSSARRLSLRVRPDLSARKHRYLDRSYWIVKEPLGLQYFRFQEEEYALLCMLDGRSSLDEIKAQFEDEFRPQKLTVEELQQFVGMLHRSGLLVALAPDQGKQLLARRYQRRKKEWLGQISNVMAIRFKGIDPQRILTWLYPKLAWLFTRTAVAIGVLLMISAMLLVLVQFKVFQSKLPAFNQFFNLHNAVWLMVVLAVTKVVHEFGHGLTCKHFGGECHEMGVMILVLTPCLYCNVSDSWMLPGKWHRAAIGAAGMYVEVVIASLCTFIWWFSEPGMLNHLALSTMFVCSISTVLFNGNPLLRYDGYYILSDLIEIPNLSQKSSSVLGRTLGSICLGLEPPDDPFMPQRRRWLFATYAVASALYRWVVVLSIVLFLNKVFEPYRLQIIGRALGLMALYGLLLQPLWKVGKFFYVPGRIDLVKKKRMFTTLAALGLVVLGVFLLPLPHRVFCTLELAPRDAHSIYVEVPGQLQEAAVKPGQKVEVGTMLGRLDNPEISLQLDDLLGQRDLYVSQLANLRQQRFRDPAAGLQIPRVQESLAAVEQQLQQKQTDLKRLVLVSPVAGTVLPPSLVPQGNQPEGELPTWSGTPLEAKNLGCLLDASVLFCQIGDPRRMEAILVIDQADIEFVRLGQSVEIKLDELAGTTLKGRIRKIAKTNLKVSPKRLSNKAGGELATKTDPSGVERPLSTSYPARVFPLDDPDGLLRIGLLGRAKIHVGRQTPAELLARFFKRTFHFGI